MKNIYVCGPTVYAPVHIGNLRPIITFDIYRRSLESLGEEVNFIHNITDIDDKIIKRAKEENITEQELADKYKKLYLDILDESNVIMPNSMPEVVGEIKGIVKFIKRLIKTNKAYEVNGNVYFDTSIDGYGKVSNRKIEEMILEGGVDKKNPADFVLWKNTNEGVKFDSPWGKGRPGWHTECAYFIDKALKGESLDIHGGGVDLTFPHHENENAQYLALNNIDITKKWKHMGTINLDGEKMAKSTGNVFNAKEFIDKNGNDLLRLVFLTSSPTAPIDINNKMLNDKKIQLEKYRKIFISALGVNRDNSKKNDILNIAESISKWQFANAMKDVNLITKEFNKNKNSENADKVIKAFKLLGFNFSNITVSKEDIKLIDEWNSLRSEGDFKAADKIREKLMKKNLA